MNESGHVHCTACGSDISQAEQVRDAQGNVICTTCWSARQPATPRPSMSPPPPPTAPPPPPPPPYPSADPRRPAYPLQYQAPPIPMPAIKPFVDHVWKEFKLCARRALVSDFQAEKATDAERQKLAAASTPLTSPMVQDYAGWRRSMLWLASGMMVLTALFAIINAEWFGARDVGWSDWNAFVLNTWQSLQLIIQVGAVVLVIMAALWWHEIGKTRRMARWGWMLQFFGVFLLFLIPVVWMLDMEAIAGRGASPQEALGARVGLGAVIALTALITLLPRIIGLFPGVLRASLTLKTLLPEASAPGWVAIIVAPPYALVFALFLVLSIQIDFNRWFSLALLCLAVAPLVSVWRARELMTPTDGPTGHYLIQSVRRQILSLVGLGVLFLLIGCLTLLEHLTFWEIFRYLVQFLSGILANILLLTVVTSDLIIGLMRQAFHQGKTFHGSELQGALEAKFEQLADGGLTDLEAGEGDFASRISATARRLSRASRDWLSAKDQAPPPPPAGGAGQTR